MKKQLRNKQIIFSILLSFFLLTGCANNHVNDQNNTTANDESQIYHEIETNLTSEVIDDFGSSNAIKKEITRLKKKDRIFWYNQDHKIQDRMSMYRLREKVECRGTKDSCSIIGVQVQKKNLSPDLKTDKCDSNDWCLVAEPEFPKDLAKNIKHFAGFYSFGKDVYMIGSTEKYINSSNYSIFKNEEEIFSHKMYYGTESVIEDAAIISNSPAFTFYDLKEWKDENNPVVSRNIWHKGETLNEKYEVEASSYLFSFKNKTGFVGEKDGEKFIFFNNQKISQDFNEIRTSSCCTAFAYPIKLDKDGILFFLAKRGEKYFFVEIGLNKYL